LLNVTVWPGTTPEPVILKESVTVVESNDETVVPSGMFVPVTPKPKPGASPVVAAKFNTLCPAAVAELVVSEKFALLRRPAEYGT
jgi:hypothetical protein